LVARMLSMHEVTGSIPVLSTFVGSVLMSLIVGCCAVVDAIAFGFGEELKFVVGEIVWAWKCVSVDRSAQSSGGQSCFSGLRVLVGLKVAKFKLKISFLAQTEVVQAVGMMRQMIEYHKY
jgi:hypothetical protein